MVKIRGLVRALNHVRDKLQTGIPENEIDDFRSFVRKNITQVERICSNSGVTPKELPCPSRNAYFFLKQLDLDNLPICSDPPKKPRRIKIANIIKNMNLYSEAISRIATRLASDERESEKNKLRKNLLRSINNIEKICAQAGSSPQGLNTPSRKAYSLMKFLTSDDNLDLHINTVERVSNLIRAACNSHHIPHEHYDIIVEISNFEGLFLSRRYKDAIFFRINEGFIDADDDVIRAIVEDAILNKSLKNQRIVDDYVNSEEYQSVMIELEMACGVEQFGPLGQHYDLREIFASVNSQYFSGGMAQPLLTWNRTITARKFGHYVPSRDLVMVSITLDDPKIPSFVVEFIMYHELLHKKIGIKWKSGRRLAHTSTFRDEEKKFEKYHEAEKELKNISRNYC